MTIFSPASINNISVVSWQSVLLVEETRSRVPRVARETTILWQVTDKLYHIMMYRVYLTRPGFKLITLEVIGTDLHRYTGFSKFFIIGGT
jgi:hypothetical protein